MVRYELWRQYNGNLCSFVAAIVGYLPSVGDIIETNKGELFKVVSRKLYQNSEFVPEIIAERVN